MPKEKKKKGKSRRSRSRDSGEDIDGGGNDKAKEQTVFKKKTKNSIALFARVYQGYTGKVDHLPINVSKEALIKDLKQQMKIYIIKNLASYVPETGPPPLQLELCTDSQVLEDKRTIGSYKFIDADYIDAVVV